MGWYNTSPACLQLPARRSDCITLPTPHADPFRAHSPQKPANVRQRARERFGFTWTKEHRREAVRQIQAGESNPLDGKRRKSLRLCLHVVTVAGRRLVCGYSAGVSSTSTRF